MTLVTDLGPTASQTAWLNGQALLRQGRVRLAHIDTGLAPHPVLGFGADGRPPPNIRMDEGVNFHDPLSGERRPVSTLRRGRGLMPRLTEYPDHGLKTLGIILADSPAAQLPDPERRGLRGVAPGAQIVPYRVANGPVFRHGGGNTKAIGWAIEHALALPDRPRVISISMGNPGFAGALEPLRRLLGGESVMHRVTRQQIDAAFDAGVIVVCAAGQVIEGTVYPARFARCIAVGGFDRVGGRHVHYPRGGYSDAQRVDVWARAEGINRPSGWLDEQDRPRFGFAMDDGGDEPSGTSYACPQVAAAAAMWVATYRDRLDDAFADAPWKITEAFREALKASSQHVMAMDGAGLGRDAEIRALDIERLLRTAPRTEGAFTKPEAAVKAGIW